MIKKIFIANRGEVARRIASTAKKMGMRTVCIVEKSPPSYLLGVVDEFFIVEEENVSLFLDADKMVEISLKTGCDSIHPGFGFLSESAIFAQKVQDAGLIFIGPSPEAIEKMASKERARELAEKASVRISSGFRVSSDLSLKEISDNCQKIGYPVLIKAALGGGGKGLRIVHKEEELSHAIERARSEALSSFNDITLIVEEYVASARHVEVQILADQHKNVRVVGDRDCSVQRRHQKIIEECPAFDLSEELRNRLHNDAKNLAELVNYSSCGTVEFLVLNDKHYFLEMNTRLQVEHTVTEEVYNIDLVEWQIRIARQESLPATTWIPQGHAIQARIYAEDPYNNFMPSPGGVCGFVPFYNSQTRWEIGLETFGNVSRSFDPMVAKVIAKGSTRQLATKSLIDVLECSFLPGLKSNREYLLEILRSEEFQNKNIHTGFLGLNNHKLTQPKARETDTVAREKALLLCKELEGLSKENLNIQGVAQHTNAIFQGAVAAPFEAKQYKIFECLQQKISEKEHVTLLKGVTTGKEPISFLLSIKKTAQEKFCFLLYDRFYYEFLFKRKTSQQSVGTEENSSSLKAPVPGKIVKISIKEGDEVTPDTACCVLESMKMEFVVKAKKKAVVRKVLVKEGQQVGEAQLIAELQ